MTVFLRSAWALVVAVMAAVFVTGSGVIVSFFTGGAAPEKEMDRARQLLSES